MNSGPHKKADESDASAIVKDSTKGNTKIYPHGLNITWGNDDRYWHIIKSTDSTDSPEKKLWVAELKQVSWLEVTCSTDNVKVGKKYNVGFTVSMRPDSFGWDGVDVYVMAKVGKSGKFTPMKVCLGDVEPNKNFTIPKKPLEIEVPSSTSPEKRTIHLGLYEVWSSKWKGGLQIHDAYITQIDV